MPLPHRKADTVTPPLPYAQRIDGCFAHVAGPHGVDTQAFQSALGALAPAMEALEATPRPEAAAITKLAGYEEDLPTIEELAAVWRAQYAHLIVIGAGGSGLSGKALALLKRHQLAYDTSPTLCVLDNLDAYTLTSLIAEVDITRAAFFIVSKAGITVETHACLQVLLTELKARAALTNMYERFAVMTMENNNPLHRLARDYGMRVMAHDADLGGRFSILSGVGLVPASFMGLDIRALRRGAGIALSHKEEAAKAAAIQYLLMAQGKNISVLFPYSDRLWGLALWWRQSWAESLGKNGKGSTPHISLGTTDQHSQLQLYLDGPKDKLFTLLLPESQGLGPVIAPNPYMESVQGKALGDIIAAQQCATAESLMRSFCPVRMLTLPRVDEETLGALIMQFTLEIIFTAHLLDVDPFDQPAVEESKRLTREFLQKQ